MCLCHVSWHADTQYEDRTEKWRKLVQIPCTPSTGRIMSTSSQISYLKCRILKYVNSEERTGEEIWERPLSSNNTYLVIDHIQALKCSLFLQLSLVKLLPYYHRYNCFFYGIKQNKYQSFLSYKNWQGDWLKIIILKINVQTGKDQRKSTTKTIRHYKDR